MTKHEKAFISSALTAAGNRDGNFDFICPHCGGYSIGVRKSEFGVIIASCHNCGLYIKEKILLKKGA